MTDTAGPDSTPTARPTAVTTALVALVGAVGCGVAETAVRGVSLLNDDPADIGSVAESWLIRSVIYVVVLGIAWRMSRGDRWARILLTVGIGVIGTASLIVEPLRMFATADTDPSADIGAPTVLMALTRIGHLCAVWIAIPAMYTPAARAWFRGGLAHRADRRGE